MTRRSRFSIGVGSIAVSLVCVASASAEILEVDTTAGFTGVDADCSLAEATLTANGNTTRPECGPTNGLSADMITFAPAVFPVGAPAETIDLASFANELGIGGDTEIVGPGRGELVVTNSNGTNRIFSVFSAGTDLTISGMDITSGNISGPGGILEGGAILNTGGTALLALSNVRIADSTVTSTTPTPSGTPATARGGAISSLSPLSLDRVVLENNSVTATSDSAGDTQPTAQGGSLFASVSFSVDRSTISGNSAQAVEANGATSALAQGGGARLSSSGTVKRSTISGNQGSATTSSNAVVAGGGLYGGSNLELSTVTGNTTQLTGDVTSSLFGGGVNGGAGLEVVSSTIADNGPVSGSSTGANVGAPVELNNTIVADPRGATSTNCDVGAASNDFNLEDGTSCNLGQASDITGEPLLGPLQNNGGPTLTRRPGPGSPVIDQGTDDDQTLNTDQRELSRVGDFLGGQDPDNGQDIGAVEVQISPPTFSGTTPGSPSADDTPEVRGNVIATPDVTLNNPRVQLYTVPGCSSGATGPLSAAATFSNPGITVGAVPHNATTTFFGRVTTTYGSSVCATGGFPSSISYTQADPPPVNNPPSTGTTTPLAPAQTGQRAAALKKCKRKRSARARRNCRKRAQKLPL